MRRMPVRPLVWMLAASVVVGMGPAMPVSWAAEHRQVVAKGVHRTFGSLPQTGAVTFLARSDSSGGSSGKVGGSGKGKGGGQGWLPSQEPWWQRALAMLTDGLAYANSGNGKGQGGSHTAFNIDGQDATLDRVDGRNYDLSGHLVGSGDKAGVALDVDQSYLTTSDVTIAGSPAIQANVNASIDVGSYVTYLSARANATYTTDQHLTNQTIGGPSNYQVVVVQDAKLTLDGTTTGYGVLVLYDSLVSGSKAQLVMKDTAKWYGVILFYTGNSSGNASRFQMQGDSENQSGNGSGKGKGKGHGDPGEGVQVFGEVIIRGYQFTIQHLGHSVGDIFYSSAAVNSIDGMLGNTKFAWENWRER